MFSSTDRESITNVDLFAEWIRFERIKKHHDKAEQLVADRNKSTRRIEEAQNTFKVRN